MPDLPAPDTRRDPLPETDQESNEHAALAVRRGGRRFARSLAAAILMSALLAVFLLAAAGNSGGRRIWEAVGEGASDFGATVWVANGWSPFDVLATFATIAIAMTVALSAAGGRLRSLDIRIGNLIRHDEGPPNAPSTAARHADRARSERDDVAHDLGAMQVLTLLEFFGAAMCTALAGVLAVSLWSREAGEVAIVTALLLAGLLALEAAHFLDVRAGANQLHDLLTRGDAHILAKRAARLQGERFGSWWGWAVVFLFFNVSLLPVLFTGLADDVVGFLVLANALGLMMVVILVLMVSDAYFEVGWTRFFTIAFALVFCSVLGLVIPISLLSEVGGGSPAQAVVQGVALVATGCLIPGLLILMVLGRAGIGLLRPLALVHLERTERADLLSTTPRAATARAVSTRLAGMIGVLLAGALPAAVLVGIARSSWAIGSFALFLLLAIGIAAIRVKGGALCGAEATQKVTAILVVGMIVGAALLASRLTSSSGGWASVVAVGVLVGSLATVTNAWGPRNALWTEPPLAAYFLRRGRSSWERLARHLMLP
ncbi:hypothetical protein [Oerskovia sp. KBS0722]|uniref:hypothetical protein n=1 Tax=Oerskovia sp. KBS0722 TaxID=1179673 RepID=UPI00110E9E84|nr:hypothetical protein [Oerskovia sp. KBS0722]QDW63901.1 hypothetical protein FFI11_016530 [Oerskovia sp. KBS0722]